ncbi:MAG: hypothetical protein RDU76_11900, partial [Candidatus Edwardsbacteria bacterium]|nr:hypothetical protein [Candidatus Edwardsbacteria bacterium]
GGPPRIVRATLDTLNRRNIDITEGTDLSGTPYYNSGEWFYHLAGDKTGLWAGRGWTARNYDADHDTIINGLFYYDFKTNMWFREIPDAVGLSSDYITGLADWEGTVMVATKEAVYKHGARKWKKILEGSKIRILHSSTGLFIKDDKMIQQYLPTAGIWQPVCSLSVLRSEPKEIQSVPDQGMLIGTDGGLKMVTKNGKVRQISSGVTKSITRHQGKWWAIVSGEPYQIKMDGDSLRLEKPAVREECLREEFEFLEGTVPEISSSQ